MKKTLPPLYIFSFLFLFSINLFGQKSNNKYDLLFLSGTVHPESNVASLESLRAKPEETVNGKYYRIVQFIQIPSDEEKQELKNSGVELLGYLPNFSYFAAINNTTSLTAVNTRGNIRAVLPVAPEYKTHPSITNGKLPDHAEVIKGKGDIVLTYFKGISKTVIANELKSNITHIEILEQDELSQWVKVRVDKEQISNLSLLPFVQYVEPINKVEIENNSGTTEHRSNSINNFITGGLRYDGTGVGISIGDGGAYFTHVDFTGRQKGGLATGSADHGTHVAGIAAGAGNIDSRYRGQAPGANLIYSNGFADISSVSAMTTLFNGADKIRVTNHSLGEGVNDGYTTTARQSDLNVEALPSVFNVHSCGNSGTPWNTITGGYKAGKNAIAMGALDYKDLVTSFSSRGPSADGRIKPDICTKGGTVHSTMPNNIYGDMSGTSMASPGGAGCFAQLIHAYRSLNSGSDPKLSQLKCIVLNTAEDLGNVGPDYTYGWGRVNVWKAYNAINDKRYLSSTVSNGGNQTHTIVVPANVGELKVMVYWADPAAAAGVAKALINDLDIKLASASQTYNPWVLDNLSPATAATKGQDKDNNMEQVSVVAPPAGTYTLTVNGFQVPQGPQEYWVTYEFLTDDIKITYPMGGESFVPGETEYIRWDSYGSAGNFTAEYSTNGGTTWTSISTSISGSVGYYTWVVPNTLTGKALIRVSRNSKSGTSDANFNIINVPTNLKIDWRCPASFQLSWTAVAGATEYEVYLLGQKYMESQGTTSGTTFMVNSPNTSITWTSVRALSNVDPAVGRRAIAIQVATATVGCPTSVDDINSNSSYAISVYPNPMNENSIVSIRLNEEEMVSVKLVDVLGKEVAVLADENKLPEGEHKFILDTISNSGIYFVVVKGNKGTSIGKVIVAKN